MAKQITAKIPLKRIVKMGIMDNQFKKEKIATVFTRLQKEYPNKEVYIMNCGFFSMGSKIPPVFGVKADGKELSSDWGYGWIGFKGKKIGYGNPNTLPTAYTDAVTGYPVLIENGKKSPLFTTKNVDNTDRGRTMMGFNDNEIILSCIQDTAGTSDYTLNECLNYMLNQSCNFSIALDGGGSTQGIFNTDKVTSSRIVSNFFYVIADVDNSTPEKQVQNWLNATYNAKLVVDGILGKSSKTAIIKAKQKEIGVTADGSWGPKSKAAVKYLSLNSKNNTVNRVKVLQCALCRKGFWFNNIDGKFTAELDTAVRNFQKSQRLTADGCAGKDTFTALFK